MTVNIMNKIIKMSMLRAVAIALAVLFVTVPDLAAQNEYRLNPGDLLDISIWNEDNMRREVIVLPDGTISYPLAGHLKVAGRTLADVEQELKSRLVTGSFFKDAPALTVAVLQTQGNQVFVIGEVNTPGAIAGNRPLDVLQALSLAGGLSEFADESEILILRRNADGQETYMFDYSNVQAGRDVSSNIVLQSGDTIIVPASGLF